MPCILYPVPHDMSSFAGFPRCLRLEELEADITLIGGPYKSPYDVSVPARHGEGTIPAPGAAAALSRQSQACAHSLRHRDYGFSGDVSAGCAVRVVDCGDLVMDVADYRVDLQAIREAVGLILQRGAVPIVLGGDHSTSGSVSPVGYGPPLS